MSRTILLGYDDNEPSRRALDRAVDELRAEGGRLVVLSVLDLPLDPSAPRAYGTPGDGPTARGPYGEPPEVARMLGAAHTRLKELDAPAEFVWAAGEPGQIIVDVAGQRGADLIVVGSHHHGFLASLFGADVGAEVLKHAGCEVILVE
ncbi:MAG: universal stress protein [Miltoncostaeaceae bacterium]